VKQVRILIADDHDSVRASTRRILERSEGLEVVAEAWDGEEAVVLAQLLRPDVAILDILMPKMDGIQAARKIQALSPATAVLMLTVLDDDEFRVSARDAGAVGYLTKSSRGQELIAAVREASLPGQAPSRSGALVAPEGDGQERLGEG
jgi:DNA-binding NarL/FixJ family response regulator